MTRRTKYLLLGAAFAAFIGAAWAQTTQVVQNLTGNEIVQAEFGGAGGQGFYTTVNALRNATGYLLVATGSTVNTTVPATAAKLVNTGAITTWNITLPTSPYDGQNVAIACSGGAASPVVGVTGGPSGVTIVGAAFTTCGTPLGTAAQGAEYIYSTAQNKWYRIQ